MTLCASPTAVVLALALTAASTMALTAACASGAETTVFAAASLADALTEIGRDLEARSGPHLAFNFGASSDLARQILAGAPADVFFSADAAQMDRLQRAGLVQAGDRLDVLSNTLVVVVPAGDPRTLSGPAEIASFPRLALAEPSSVPAGVYARTYLESVGL